MENVAVVTLLGHMRTGRTCQVSELSTSKSPRRQRLRCGRRILRGTAAVHAQTVRPRTAVHATIAVDLDPAVRDLNPIVRDLDPIVRGRLPLVAGRVARVFARVRQERPADAARVLLPQVRGEEGAPQTL